MREIKFRIYKPKSKSFWDKFKEFFKLKQKPLFVGDVVRLNKDGKYEVIK